MAVYKVGNDGKAPAGLKVGDKVVTGGGTYVISGLNADGSYMPSQSSADKAVTTANYSGAYSAAPVSRTSATSNRAAVTTGDTVTGYYKKQLEDTIAANKKAAMSSILSLDSQREQAAKAYDKSARQAYVNYMQSKKNTAAKLTANGLRDSGSTERALKLEDADYGENLTGVEQSRAGIYSELEKSKGDIYSQLAEQNNLAKKNYYSSVEQRRQQQAEAVEAQNQTVRANAFMLLASGVYSDEIAAMAGLSREVAKKYAEAAQKNRNDEYDYFAELLRRSGNYGITEEELAAIGMTPEQAEAYMKGSK